MRWLQYKICGKLGATIRAILYGVIIVEIWTLYTFIVEFDHVMMGLGLFVLFVGCILALPFLITKDKWDY